MQEKVIDIEQLTKRSGTRTGKEPLVKKKKKTKVTKTKKENSK